MPISTPIRTNPAPEAAVPILLAIAAITAPSLALDGPEPNFGCVVAHSYICFPEDATDHWTVPCPDSDHPCHGTIVSGGSYIDIAPSEAGWTIGSFEIETHFVFYRLPRCIDGECCHGALKRWECPAGFTMAPLMAECPPESEG